MCMLSQRAPWNNPGKETVMNSTTVLILGTDSSFVGSSLLIALLHGAQAPFEPVVKILAEKPTDRWKAELDNALRQSKADVALFTPKLDRMPAAAVMLDCMSQSGSPIPVLVLIEN